MTINIFLLEFLPNELIVELFKYFKTQDLFQAFYNLNTRFNYLIHSLTHLTYSTNETDNYPPSYPFIRTLIIDTKIEDRLNCFPHVRRLILDYITDDLISQLNTSILPNLEHLSIYHKVNPLYMPDLRTKVFSNIFPTLKYCYISRMKPPYEIQKWTQSLSLRCLKLTNIDSFIYTSVLTACPNLYYLKFNLLNQSAIQSDIVLHTNLKQLVINMIHDDWPWDDSVIEVYLSCVPNLEQFRIYRSVSGDLNVMDYFQYYDWLLSIISSRLVLLSQFKFVLWIKRFNGLINCPLQDIYYCLERKFNNVYKGRYRSRLVFS